MSSLTKTEQYALAQILICGQIDRNEFGEMNDFIPRVQHKIITELQEKGALEHTLFENEY
jgi:hypothetical protein